MAVVVVRWLDQTTTLLGLLPADLHPIINQFSNRLQSRLDEPITQKEIKWCCKVRKQITVFYFTDDDSCEVQPWKEYESYTITDGIFLWKHAAPPNTPDAEFEQYFIAKGIHIYSGRSVALSARKQSCEGAEQLSAWIINKDYTDDDHAGEENPPIKRCLLDIHSYRAILTELTLKFLADAVEQLRVYPIALEAYLRTNVDAFGLCKEIPNSYQGDKLVCTMDQLNEKSEQYQHALTGAIETMR